jgi:hypothetical protein
VEGLLQTVETFCFQQSRCGIDVPVPESSSDGESAGLVSATCRRSGRQQKICDLGHRRHYDDGLQPAISPPANDVRRTFHGLGILN